MAHQAAGFLELGLQGGDALLGFAGLLARGQQFVARAAGFFLDGARLGHHLVEQRADLGDVAGLGDALRAVADAVVVGAGALGEARELVDETGEHVAQVALGLGQGVLELALLEDELLEPAAGVVELARVGLGVDDLAQHLDLAAQPLVVEHELVDVAQEQTQEFEQAGAHLGVVCGGELDFAGERAQLLAELLQPLNAVALGELAGQGERCLLQGRVLGEQGGDGLAIAQAQQVAQGVGGLRAWAGGGGRGGGGRRGLCGRGRCAGPGVGLCGGGLRAAFGRSSGRLAGSGFCRARLVVGGGLAPAAQQALQAGV